MTVNSNYIYFRLISLFLILWCIQPVFAQDYLFDVEVIGVKNGLPHLNAYNILQDKDGFIWVSSIGNISRYDGYNFKTYDHDFLNIPESTNVHIAIDTANYLWYCEGGFNKKLQSGVIDIRKDTVYSMETISKGRFTSTEVSYVINSKVNPELIFITTRSGVIYKYDGHFEEIYHFPQPPSFDVLCEIAPDGSYWIIHDTAIKVKDGKRIKTIPFFEPQKGMEGAIRIVSVHPYLILEISGPLATRYMKLEKDTFVPFSVQKHGPDDIKGLFQQNKDYSIYTTKNALFIRDKQGKILYTSDEFEFLKFGQNLGYYPPFTDQQNILWVPTESGILKINAKRIPFEIIDSGNSIRGIFQDDKRLWIGGYNRNSAEDIKTGSKDIFFPFPIVGTSFCKDDKGHIWIGTAGSYMRRYIPERNVYIDYIFDPENTTHLPFQNVIKKNYWVGSNNGLFRLDTTHKEITPFSLPIATKGLDVRQIYQDTKDIWIITNKGIFLMDAEKEIIVKHYTKASGLPTENINHLYEDKNGIFWIGTKRSGLVRWNRSDNTFRHYTRENGLSNNTIYAVYEDDFETLWLPSNYGLMAFDKNAETTRLYLPENGIAHEEFNTYAHFQAKDGTLYFGGLNGITKFHPKDLQEDYNTSPPLYVTKIRVLEKDAEGFTDHTSKYVNTKKIDLNSSDRILEVDLTLLDYRKSSENQYAYKIEKHQEQWVYTSDRTLSIINPPYGNYNLVIKARGTSGSWSDRILTIPVHKPLPFYQQWWFILIFIVVMAFIVIMMVRWRVKRLEKDRQRLEAEVRKRTLKISEQAEALKTLDQAKSRFFSNITHEFRTPLTLIIGPIEQLMANSIPTTMKAKMQSIQRNAKQLLGLINQLLDISKLESGQLEVKTSTADIVAFTSELVRGFQPLALRKAQQLSFKSDTDAWETHFDTEKFSEIVYNLVSNAIKYTPEEGHIEISLLKAEKVPKEYIRIQVKDTGIGIREEALTHIFDRFYQVDDSATRKGEGTGIGLALVKELVELQQGTITVKSHVGEGSTFTVTLPVLATPVHPDVDFEPIKPEIPSDEPVAGITPNETQSTQASQENKLELLIIEDNAQMREYIRSCIDPSIYHISEAVDGQQGIEKTFEIIPDLIISDIMMPGKDGFELTHDIRNHTATSHIPLILLTAKAAEESRLEGLERGADAYLTKPFNPKELNLRVKKLIELRKLLRDRYQGDQLPTTDPIFQKEDQFVKELKNYIAEHISKPELNVDVISKHFSISRAQFYRKLNAIIHVPLTDYIRSIRLETAIQMLKSRQLTIAEVAYATGFSSPAYFSTSFKKVYGKPPSEWQ